MHGVQVQRGTRLLHYEVKTTTKRKKFDAQVVQMTVPEVLLAAQEQADFIIWHILGELPEPAEQSQPTFVVEDIHAVADPLSMLRKHRNLLLPLGQGVCDD